MFFFNKWTKVYITTRFENFHKNFNIKVYESATILPQILVEAISSLPTAYNKYYYKELKYLGTRENNCEKRPIHYLVFAIKQRAYVGSENIESHVTKCLRSTEFI